MKKFTAILLALMLCAALLSVPALAAGEVTVNVSISSAGTLVAARQSVTVTDVDADGALTIGDALYCAHELLYKGGAAAGYATESTDFGLSLTMLWGEENGGSYGYYVNDAAALSLSDPISSGDYLYAYSYADLAGWSDMYSYFSKNAASVPVGEPLSLTLAAAGFDEAWNPVTLTVEDAVITCTGGSMDFTNGENGAFTVKFDKAGTYVLSAASASSTITPPVCVVTVAEPGADGPQTGSTVTALALLALLSAGAAVLSLRKRANF